MALNFANNNSLSAITTKPSGLSGGALNLISTQTASSSSTISFTSGIDSTYDEYVFKFYDIHPSANANFTFQADTGTNTSYNQTITSTYVEIKHTENDSETQLRYKTDDDLAQSTSFHKLCIGIGTTNDNSCSGQLTIFSPSSSVFVKHFISQANNLKDNDQSNQSLTAGYFNTTTALTRFQFKMASGNIDSGVIKLYGIS